MCVCVYVGCNTSLSLSVYVDTQKKNIKNSIHFRNKKKKKMDKFNVVIEEDRRATEGRIVLLHFVEGSPEHTQYMDPAKREKCLVCGTEEWAPKICGWCQTAR